MVSSINEEPNGNTTNLDSRNERSKIFCITCSSTAPSLEKQKSILDEMTEFVEIFIVFSLAFPVFSRRNDRNHSHLGGFEKDCVCVIAPVCQKIFRPETLHQLRCNCAIRFGTRSDKESHRHTMRIHGQMYLGIMPPFVRSIA